MIRLEVELTEDQAEALAQLLKRIGWAEWRGLSVSDAEAELMRSASEALRSALARQGYAPR